MSTQATIKINGFSTFISDYIQPEALSSLKIEDAESESTPIILAGGETIDRSMLKVAQPTSLTVNSNELKLKDPSQYRAMLKSGTIGSGATITVGLETTTYTKVIVTSPLKTVGNSGEDNEVMIVFAGSGKR
jgi:hypothetical protein